MNTETIDRLFLELSQFTTAKTKRETELDQQVAEAQASEAAIYQQLELTTKHKELFRKKIAEARALAETASTQVADLVLLVGRLVQQVRRYEETNDVASKAMDYIRRKDLMPSIVRGVGSNETAEGGGES